MPETRLRIGELSRRTGVGQPLLRAWESRYGLLSPTRSPGGLRLYSEKDVERVRVMRSHLADGIAAAQAAQLALGDPTAGGGAPALHAEGARAELSAALDRFDEPAAQAVFDRLLAQRTLESLLAEVVLPYLAELGGRWERGEASVAQEHFASAVVRGRLLGLARGWGVGLGPLAVLACLPGERHDLGLIAFGLALRAQGWRIVFLGSDTPVETVAELSHRLEPELVTVTATLPERVREATDALRELAGSYRVAVAGPGVSAVDDGSDELLALRDDPVTEAARLSAERLRAGRGS